MKNGNGKDEHTLFELSVVLDQQELGVVWALLPKGIVPKITKLVSKDSGEQPKKARRLAAASKLPKEGTAAAKIIAALAKHGPMTQAALGKVLKSTPMQAIYSTIYACSKRGVIRKLNDGRYEAVQ